MGGRLHCAFDAKEAVSSCDVEDSRAGGPCNPG